MEGTVKGVEKTPGCYSAKDKGRGHFKEGVVKGVAEKSRGEELKLLTLVTFEKAISGEQWSKKYIAGLGSEEMVKMWRWKVGALLRGFWQRSRERKVHSKEVGSNVKGR